MQLKADPAMAIKRRASGVFDSTRGGDEAAETERSKYLEKRQISRAHSRQRRAPSAEAPERTYDSRRAHMEAPTGAPPPTDDAALSEEKRQQPSAVSGFVRLAFAKQRLPSQSETDHDFIDDRSTRLETHRVVPARSEHGKSGARHGGDGSAMACVLVLELASAHVVLSHDPVGAHR